MKRKPSDETIFFSHANNCCRMGNGLIALECTAGEQGLSLTGFGLHGKASMMACKYVPPVFETGLRESFSLKNVHNKRIILGGRPAARLAMELVSDGITCLFFAEIFPKSPVVRLWYELENTSCQPVRLSDKMGYSLLLDGGFMDGATHFWMIGDNNKETSLTIQSKKTGPAYDMGIVSEKHDQFIPWMCVQAPRHKKDGCAQDIQNNAMGGQACSVWLDYSGGWEMRLAESKKDYIYRASFFPCQSLMPGEKFAAPKLTLMPFTGDFDNMMTAVYDWQYTYLWDYTSERYYAKTKFLVPWHMGGKNLQENFTSRIAKLDFDAAARAQYAGAQAVWHDAAWSEGLELWNPSQEGPDFSHTTRYLEKLDMYFILWFAGHPPLWLMNTKAGAWGDFQWRTDGLKKIDYGKNKKLRQRAKDFLDENPGSSFHTCDEGSKYAHSFEVQRLADVSYLADIGNGEHLNRDISYWEPSDKWLDIMDLWLGRGHFNITLARRILAAVPAWGYEPSEESLSHVRRTMEIYRYLKRQGVAGRWSYMFHPRVEGDNERYYLQRTSYDRKKAAIIFLRFPKSFDFTIYPKGLIEEHIYTINLESRKKDAKVFTSWGDDGELKTERTGRDLMENGIPLSAQCLYTGEVLYLGLPNRPEIGADKTPPQALGRVYTRREINSGRLGVGVYWSPGADNNWIKGYEIKRNNTMLSQVSTGLYYFDSSAGCDERARYSVRTIDGDNNKSGWTAARRIPDEPACCHALGGHFEDAGRQGWHAQYSTDGGHTYLPMEWLAPAYSTAGDCGGRADQPGGAEGYWCSPQGAIVGRGFQQPVPGCMAVRAFVAPKDGEALITGRAMKEYYRQGRGGEIHVEITKNTERIWGGQTSAKLFDLYGEGHHFKTVLKKGDVLRFAAKADNDDEILAWMPSITYAEPQKHLKQTVLRLNCGGAAFTDEQGKIWTADRTYLTDCAQTKTVTDRTCPEKLYRTGRQGRCFEYKLPVREGLYTARLLFRESVYQYNCERPFDIFINGQAREVNFDIRHEGRRFGDMVQKLYPYIVPDGDGNITIGFCGGFDPCQKTDEALISGIEILPQATECIRINCGGRDHYIDWNSNVWQKDDQNGEGRVLRSDMKVAQASPTLHDQSLYQTARVQDKISYTFTLPQALYTVHLKFAELWEKSGGRGLRIEVNGKAYKDNCLLEGPHNGEGRAVDIRLRGICPDAHGGLRLDVYGTHGKEAVLQAIEIY